MLQRYEVIVFHNVDKNSFAVCKDASLEKEFGHKYCIWPDRAPSKEVDFWTKGASFCSGNYLVVVVNLDTETGLCS